MTAARYPMVTMTDLADLVDWTGLAPGLNVDDLTTAGVIIDPELTGTGTLGSAEVPAQWFAAESFVYEHGVRVWVRDDQVVLITGDLPVGPDGEPPVAGGLDELGPPERVFGSYLGRVQLEDAEQVFAARGLALTINPENNLVLSVYGFAPTTVDDYERTVRPHKRPKQLLVNGAARGAAT